MLAQCFGNKQKFLPSQVMITIQPRAQEKRPLKAIQVTWAGNPTAATLGYGHSGHLKVEVFCGLHMYAFLVLFVQEFEFSLKFHT